MSSVKKLPFHSLHLCYAKLVCVLVLDARKVAAVVCRQKFRSRNTSRSDVHGAGNFPGDLHQGARGGKGAGDVVRGVIFLRWPVAQIRIQIGGDKWHRDGLSIHGGGRAELASNVQ